MENYQIIKEKFVTNLNQNHPNFNSIEAIMIKKDIPLRHLADLSSTNFKNEIPLSRLLTEADCQLRHKNQ